VKNAAIKALSVHCAMGAKEASMLILHDSKNGAVRGLLDVISEEKLIAEHNKVLHELFCTLRKG